MKENIQKENLETTDSLASGIADFLYNTIYGIMFSFLLIIINNLVDFFWGSTIVQIYMTVTSSFIVAIYSAIHKWTKKSVFYLMGWVIGLYVIYRLNLFSSFSSNQLLLWIIIPIAIHIFRFIINYKKNKG